MRWLPVAAAAAALAATAPSPRACLLVLTSPATALGTDPLAPVVALVWLLAFGVAAWLGLVAVVAATAGLPGRVGAAASAVLRRVAPRALRLVLVAAAGAAGATSGGGLASAAESTPSVTAGSSGTTTGLTGGPSLDWPGADALDPAPLPPPAPAPTTAPPSSAAPRPAAAAPTSQPTAPAAGGAHVVAVGDTLWDLAEASLGPSATPAQVARAWPTWWSANRGVVGDDPDLLRPGTRLVPPA